MAYYIGLSEITVKGRYEDKNGQSIRYDAEISKRPLVCDNPDCVHKSRPHIHDHRPYRLLDVKSEGKIVVIELTINRYRCPDCDKVFSDTFFFFDKRSHLTNRLKQEFIKRSISGETYSHIAQDYGVDPKTVAAVFDAYWETHKQDFIVDVTPVYLGIDEAHIDDHYRLVLTDIEQQRLIDIKSNNHKPTVKRYLNTLDKQVCKAVAMDFAPGYATAVTEVLPNAVIVIDKFHVVQEINRCLDNVRKDIQNKIKRENGNAASFYHSRKLFLTNWEDLSLNGLDKLNEWFYQYPDLYEAYMCKETFRDIYNSITDYPTASELFDKWLSAIPDFERFQAMKNTMTERRNHILNYWRYPVTNAYTESINNRIKAIEKAGRGYKFENLRKRCLLELNAPKPEKFDPSKVTYYAPDGSKAPDRRKKIRMLYTSQVNWEQDTIIHPIQSNNRPVFQDITISAAVKGDDMKPYIDLWLTTNANHEVSFQKRMTAYYQGLLTVIT